MAWFGEEGFARCLTLRGNFQLGTRQRSCRMSRSAASISQGSFSQVAPRSLLAFPAARIAEVSAGQVRLQGSARGWGSAEAPAAKEKKWKL